MDKEKILNDFDVVLKAKKTSSTTLKIIIFFCLIVIIASLFFAFYSMNNAMNKVIVVDSGGLYLKTISEDREQLQTTLILTTCSTLMKTINSFDRNSITDNQASAYYYCAKNELLPVFEKYKQEKCYQNVVDRGVIYRCDMENVSFIGKDKEPFDVHFTAILQEIDGSFIRKYRIQAQGKLIAVKPEYPKNNTGYFFSEYRQEILAYGENNED
ncbi:hypothetical protein M2451_003888 [Dysgonomonas sp. PFB1-18]|uniref:hypothetical protein n=1 Tax=unclassified Dysgonomonas TaxID=2630389 RepID=UPI00247436D4|nr:MULTISPECIES: hypothetical protein [unclassified Dysgonomonas]MDH6311068.1 hypothetical protein [Dysgonomonas sp. PF1-14]MDH6340992.1 hypothetical protein [Dysgonomonas sp. PF1-16]MDH6382547.1 hypothetical protein [Dysgonomonas sp. PFB1-18]MDH6399919.1 hypothetical protein [Dysgonomonas sp. PF1-23]